MYGLCPACGSELDDEGIVGYVDIWPILEVPMIMTMMILMMNTCLEGSFI